MELEGFLKDHVLEYFLGWFEVVPGPVELLGRLDDRLVVLVRVKVGMHQALLYCVPFLGVEHQHLAQQLEGRRVRFREDALKWLLVTDYQLLDVLSSELVSNEGHVFLARGA